ncbi:uncharacterized protein [Venturia canescens]|uniref:uncharacterized protein n=1 Tax=Venturia canescens TaxID=32260 RepID=UPI001C9C52B9|nr:uncharacterized protein LOC122417128 [Venturia canescens]
MENKTLTDNLIRTNQTIVCSGLFNGPRLTPTGKISHAKTRVYTQRYRKEWEQMPDFRGWLTSVPNQATRAYCTYCKKNLHAHRLSLLKHTCTMKHQRAALMQRNEMNAQQRTLKSAKIEPGYEESVEPEHVIPKEHDGECEEDTEDFEYVVETLEMEDDELNDSRCKEQDCPPENMEDYDEEASINICASNEEYNSQTDQKIKIEAQDDCCCDPLAEAMAHVHGEYMVGTEEQANVDEMEMVVGQEETSADVENDTSMNSIEDDGEGDVDGDGDESQNNDNEEELKRSEGDSSEAASESEISSAHQFEELGKNLKNLQRVFNSSKLSIPSSHSSFGTPVSIPSGQTKTIKLNSGKTVTLKAGTQYVLSNLKSNNVTSLLMTDRKPAVQSDGSTKSGPSPKPNSKTTKINPYALVAGAAGTSKQSSSRECTKAGGTKKPCISTHVLDTSKGLPIGGLQVSLYKLMDGRWTFINESNTSLNGRCNDLVDNSKSNFTAGRYKIHFDVDKYFTLRRIETMYPFIEIVFDVKNPTGNYHIPVLLSPFGYTTYRGSDR